MSEVKLEPCPLCDGEARLQGDDGKFFCHCMVHDCFCSVGERYDPDGMPDHIFTDPESAAAAWNTRAPHPSHAAVEAMAQALEEATQSLETIERLAGKKEEGLACFVDVRGYAHSRATVARKALAAYRATHNKDVRP